MDEFGAFVVPVAVIAIVVWGMFRGVPIFEQFVAGAKEGISSCFSVLPSLIGLMMAVTMLSASGALDLLSSFLSPVATAIGLPADLIPLMLMRPVSGSGSTALLNHLFETNSPDSFVGRVASVMMGSTETTFYAIAVYFGAVGIKKTRHTIPAALAADASGYLFSVIAIFIFFGSSGGG